MGSREETIVRKSESTKRGPAVRGKFLCECGNSFCAEHLLLTAAEYSIRCTCGRKLVIAAGHDDRWDRPTRTGPE